MPNPIYHFFASRAGLAGSILRWTMAGFLLFYATVQSLAWSRSLPMDESFLLLTWLLSSPGSPWLMLAGKAVIGILLLFGLFTRLCALLLLCLIGWTLFQEPRPAGMELREILLSASLCFALAVAGGGSFSFDRKISSFFLPSLS